MGAGDGGKGQDPHVVNIAAVAALLNAAGQALPAGRLGRAGEIADAVYCLSSGKAGYVNGASLVVDGGLVACQPIGM